MATTKTASLIFRIDPELKEALRAAAQREHRSIANRVEVLIRNYCGCNGIDISAAPPSKGKRSTNTDQAK